jgi:hypothetical protein
LYFIILEVSADRRSVPSAIGQTFMAEKRMELIGKGGRMRKIQVLGVGALCELDPVKPIVYL